MITRFIKKKRIFWGIYLLLQTCLKHEFGAVLGCLELTPLLCRISTQVARLIDIAFPLDKSYSGMEKIDRPYTFFFWPFLRRLADLSSQPYFLDQLG